MNEIITTYLNNERMLGLSAGLVGVASILFGVLFLLYQPQFKAFAVTMIIVGGLESVAFLPGYFKNSRVTQQQTTIVDSNSQALIIEKTQHAKGVLRAFFIIKIVYASLILLSVILLSQLNMSTLWRGILTALIIHFASAITIDNFGEAYTQKYHVALKMLIQ